LDSGFIKQVRSVVNREKLKFDKKLIIFLFFVGVATIFWFLNILGKTHTTTIEYPVSFINFPEGKELVNDLPTNLQLSIEGYGYDILKYKLRTNYSEIEIDINSPNLRKNYSKEEDNYYLLSRFEKKNIAGQLGEKKIKLLEIQPDTLHFVFAKKTSKMVPIELDFKLSFEKQFMISDDITIKPDSILISGPKIMIDTVEAVYSEHIELFNLDESVNEKVLLNRIRGIDFSDKRVDLTIPIEKFTEKKIEVDIETINVPDTLKLTLYPDKTNVTFMVALSNYENINQNDFKAVIDYLILQDNIGDKVRVKLKDFPRNVKHIDYNPKYINYIIEKK
jgi:YbbR domain-containing protein